MSATDLRIGEAAEMYRKANKLTVGQMAERCVFSRRYYYTLLKRTANPRLRQIWTLLHLLPTSIETKASCEQREGHHFHIVSHKEKP